MKVVASSSVIYLLFVMNDVSISREGGCEGREHTGRTCACEARSGPVGINLFPSLDNLLRDKKKLT